MKSSQNLAVFLVLVLILFFAPTGSGVVAITSRGTWPDTWPEELEAYRDQAQTVEVVHETVYGIGFHKREDFEKAWPHILKVKTKGAPLILEKGSFTYHVSGSQAPCCVMILSPISAFVPGPNSPRELTRSEMEELVKEGKMLRASPPWPEYLYSADGELPEYVGTEDEDGRLKWVPADGGCRARVDIILIADGKIVDLNRIELPADTPIIDNRFKKPHNNTINADKQ